MPIAAPYGSWDPATPAQVAALFSAMPCRWWIAGGHAIERAAGHRIRDHGDIDVIMLRPDQRHLRSALPGWQLWAADPPGTLRPWEPSEVLAPPIHDIWCRTGNGGPWRIQVMFEETRDGAWVSRRDPAVRRPLADIGEIGPDGIPYLAPEIQLYYKAKHPRPKDEADFRAVLPVLGTRRRRWLSAALARAFGAHPWQERLAGEV